ncbi:MAG: alpha/beta hydrolase [Gemmatimonadetes bacterium]|nr:alpha/beta hydrolase [Gemmatimonadota bacterium]
MRGRKAIPTISAPGLLALALAGCVDGDLPSGSTASPAALAVAAAPERLRDPELDRSDTYFLIEATTFTTRSSDGGGDGPGAPIGAFYIEGETRTYETGYEADGDLRASIYRDPSTDPRMPDPPGLMRTSGDYVYVYDQYGSLITWGGFNSFLEDLGLPGGSLTTATTDGAVCYDCSGGGGAPKEPIYMESVGGGPQVRQTSDGVLEVTVHLPAGTAGVQAAKDGPRSEVVRRYRKRPVRVTAREGEAPQTASRWLLDHVERLDYLPAGKVRSVTEFRYLAAHVNPGRERQREERARTAPPAPKSSAPPPAPPPTGMATPAPAASNVTASSGICGEGSVNLAHPVDGTGAPVLWQHGICSDGGTWNGMRPRIDQSHQILYEQAYSLNTLASLESQTVDLEGRVAARGIGGNVVVSHSQGGLIARRLGQRRPDLVSGVITIGTPHQGALIAQNGPDWVADQLTSAVGDLCVGNIMCPYLSEVLSRTTSGFLAWGLGQVAPVVIDDRPGSEFITQLNGRHETFKRASIQMSVPERWALFRVLGDADTPRERLLYSQPLEGRTWARNTEYLYWAGWLLRDLAYIIRWRVTDYGYGWGCHQSGYRSYWEPCYDPYNYHYRWWQSSYWLTVASILDFIGSLVVNTLNRVDRVWDYMTTGHTDRTDGFIQYTSQAYPFSPGAYTPLRFTIPRGQESHTGETASHDVMTHLQSALDLSDVPRQ